MRLKIIGLALSLAAGGFCSGDRAIDEGIRRVRAHLLIDDPESALSEAQQLETRHPSSKEARSVLIEALSQCGMREEALDKWRSLSLGDPKALADNRQLSA